MVLLAQFEEPFCAQGGRHEWMVDMSEWWGEDAVATIRRLCLSFTCGYPSCVATHFSFSLYSLLLDSFSLS